MKLYSPGCHSRTLQAKALVISSINIFHQFVHVGGVALAGHFQCLLKRFTARQQTAEAQKCATSETESKKAKKRSEKGENK